MARTFLMFVVPWWAILTITANVADRVSSFQSPLPVVTSNRVRLYSSEDDGDVSEASPPITTTTSTTTTTNDVDDDQPPQPPPPPRREPSAPGAWEELHGNYVLRPSPASPPRAVLHFLGGAFVGAAPDVAYRYVLERLAAEGFLVVATPYRLSFDYLMVCDKILTRFERIAPELARQYGAVPVVGVGHSCGALLHVLVTSLFPDTPRAANALISYNNKSVGDAIPLFEELVAPLAEALVRTEGGVDGDGDDGDDDVVSLLDGFKTALAVARRAAEEGELPDDEQLRRILAASSLLPPPLQKQAAPVFASLVAAANGVSSPLRPVLADALDRVRTNADLSPLLRRSVDVLDQIPSLLEEIAVDGVRDFTPSRADVKKAARRAYRARRTLLLQYGDDGIDESPEAEALLREASESVVRVRRPMVTDPEVRREVLEGGHAAPVLAPPSRELAGRAEDLLGEDLAKNALSYRQADETVTALVRWLEEGQL